MGCMLLIKLLSRRKDFSQTNISPRCSVLFGSTHNNYYKAGPEGKGKWYTRLVFFSSGPLYYDKTFTEKLHGE